MGYYNRDRLNLYRSLLIILIILSILAGLGVAIAGARERVYQPGRYGGLGDYHYKFSFGRFLIGLIAPAVSIFILVAIHALYDYTDYLETQLTKLRNDLRDEMRSPVSHAPTKPKRSESRAKISDLGIFRPPPEE